MKAIIQTRDGVKGAVCPKMDIPTYTLGPYYEDYQKHLSTLPLMHLHESFADLPEGTEIEGEMKYQIYISGWCNCAKSRYDEIGWLNKRILFVPIQERQKRGSNDGIRVEDALPPKIEGKEYSLNVLAEVEGEAEIQVMTYWHRKNVWCNCYGQINGDGEFDDDYKVKRWWPIPTLNTNQ